MEGMDRVLAKTLNEALRSEQARVNAHRLPREHFEVDDWVWVLRPKAVGGNKMERWWNGPYRVTQRTGASSYQVRLAPKQVQDFHMA